MARLPKGKPTLRDYLREQRRAQRQQGYSSSFARSGMNVTKPGEVASDNFDGDLDAEDAGSQGWAMNGDRAAFGDVLFRPGSIGNNSLANPVAPNIIYKIQSGFSLTTAGATLFSNDLVVPDGYSSLVISGSGKVHAFNNTPSLDYLYSVWSVNDIAGANIPEACAGNGGSITSITPMSVILTGLTSGETVRVHINANTSFSGWASNPGNVAELSGSILWFR